MRQIRLASGAGMTRYGADTQQIRTGTMLTEHSRTSQALMRTMLTGEQVRRAAQILAPMIDEPAEEGGTVSRAAFAAAMNQILFLDLLERVPSGALYVAEAEREGRRVVFDHGAVRSVCLPAGDTGALPRGELAFRRILEPLGYHVAAVYPLPKLGMTGRAYRHRDFPETLPQFFVSELHVDRFDGRFAAAAERVFGTARDPLDEQAKRVLRAFAAGRAVDLDQACRAMPVIVGAFGRHHETPALADYETLRASSREAAWIATEGNAFNHATDRVADVEAFAEAQRRLGRPIKDRVERSANGRVRQTAFRADMVQRLFRTADGGEIMMTVPGSFYEFISRDTDPETGMLDLSFDSGNATGIFTMTRGA